VVQVKAKRDETGFVGVRGLGLVLRTKERKSSCVRDDANMLGFDGDTECMMLDLNAALLYLSI